MKNKKLLYVLIPGTILIWGVIIYKIVFCAGGDEIGTYQKVETAEALPNNTYNDTFSISPTYRDPFFGKQVKKIVASTSSSENVKKIIVPIITTEWPDVIYGGIVKNQKSNKQLVLIQINGQSNMMKAGERVNNIELTKVFKDSIEVKFGKEKKYIRK